MKFSKDLIELRDKEAKLVKMKKYDDAEKVKMKNSPDEITIIIPITSIFHETK